MNLRSSERPGISLAFSAAVLAITAVVLFYASSLNETVAVAGSAPAQTHAVIAAPAATFAADPPSLGAIPDHVAGCDATGGAPRNVTFTVSGLSGPVSNVEISNLTFGSPVHSWVGDIEAVLIAPNGASHMVFGRTLATTATSCGDSTDAAGPYTFADSAAAPPNGGWWQTANILGAAVPMTAGAYRTTAIGGGATNPQPPTNMNAAFAGVANPNGTWTLRLSDHGGGDTGAVSAATLTVQAGAVTPADAAVDFTGDGRSDFVIVRNTGGGPSGQITWVYQSPTGGAPSAFQWGIASDQFNPDDFDGDGKDDIAIWRAGPAGTAAFYILNSNGFTARVEPFGQTGDQPDVVGDYNNDGKADVAVYRPGAVSGDQSTWFYRTSPGGPVAFVGWGQNGDFPAPGDYDGDGRNDFVVQRNNGGGQARFWMSLTSDGISTVVFGTPTDVIVPGDYDGDGKTDIATIRSVGGNIGWFVRPSSTGVIPGSPTAIFGISATDFPAMGDYDGDGKSDFAIWRPDAAPGNSAYWIQTATGSVIAAPFGQNGDYPVANFNTH